MMPIKKTIYLVWSLTESGDMILHSICTTQTLANTHRKLLINPDSHAVAARIINAWIERRTSNHLFGEMFKIPRPATAPVPEERGDRARSVRVLAAGAARDRGATMRAKDK